MHSKSDTPNDSFKKRVDPAQQGLPPFEDDRGTKPSNTVPPTSINNSNTKILRTGIDSLYLSYRGEIHDDSSIRLTELKKLAQSDQDSNEALAQFKVGNHVLEVLSHGRPPYTYVLTDGWFRIEVAKAGATRLPMAYCKIASSLLTSNGHEFAVKALDKIITAIGSPEGHPNVSRIDVCVDFTTDTPLDQLTEHEFVTKARSSSRHIVSRQFSGFSFSAGSPTSARLYNKSLEIQSKKNPRPDLELLWRQNGWDGIQDVWRLEFQLRRETLAAFELTSYRRAVAALPSLWAYATQQWLRHTCPSSSDSTQSRWPTSPFWEAIQNADWYQGDCRQLSRVYLDSGRTPSDFYLFVNGLSPITSFAARHGYTNAEDAAKAFFAEARKFHDERASESNRSGRQKGLDVDFEEYFRQKADNKRRAYNTFLNRPLDDGVHPAEKAVAREYRKRSDGE